MTLKQFINENKEMLDNIIKEAGGSYFNYDERRLWVLNDEGLYRMARSAGVKI
jgi:hypothetical protein